MAQKILGLDIGAHSVKAVLLEGTMRGWELRSHTTVPLPPPDEEATAAEATEPASAEPGAAEATAPAAEPSDLPKADLRLARALGQVAEQIGGLRADVVAVSLPGTGAASPLVTLPFTDPRKIDATLGFEVEGLLPFDLDEALYDAQVLSQAEGKSDLLVGVVRRDDFAILLAQLQAAGVDPRVVTLPGLALEGLAADLAQRHGVGADDHVAVLDVGHERSVLTVVRGAGGEKQPATLQFTRTFSSGAAALDGLDLADEATARRRLQPLLREVRQSLRAAQTRTRKQAARLFLGGSLAQVPGLAALLGRELGVPVDTVSLPGDAAAKIPAEQQPAYTQALGLALRAMARGQRLLNFRKGPFAFKGDLDYLKDKVSRLVAFAAALLLLVGASFWAQLETVKAQEAQLDEALCQVTQRVLGSCETDFNIALSKLQGGDTRAAQIPTASAMEVFSEAVARMPGNVGLRFDEVDVALDRMRLRGVVDSFDGVDQVVAGLKRSRCVGEVRQGRVQRTREDKIEFTLDALYVCGQNAGNSGAGSEG